MVPPGTVTAKEQPMTTLSTGPATRAPALRDREHAELSDRDHRTGPSRMWALVEALAYAGVFIDPSGALGAQRLRRAREEAERRGR
jgi:hypothetical protein